MELKSVARFREKDIPQTVAQVVPLLMHRTLLRGSVLCVLVVIGTALPLSTAGAQPQTDTVAAPTASVVSNDTSAGPDLAPYTTDRSLGYFVLAAPAYVLHGVTRPLGWGVQYLEENFPEVFEPTDLPRGLYPLMEFGGARGFLAGVGIYDNRLFGSRHRARVQAMYGGPETFEWKASHTLPDVFGPRTRIQTTVNMFSDPESEFYLGGNDNVFSDDEAYYSRDQFDVTTGVRYSSPSDLFSGGVDLLYEHVEVAAGPGRRGRRLAERNPSGLGTAELFTSRLLLSLDFSTGRPRTYRGTEFLLRFDYTHDLSADRYQYGRYVAEVRQYLPVGIFPKTRRLAVRARLEQVAPLRGGSAVPFYQLPDLGGQTSLRGFRSRRFQNDGLLLVSAEYRYPIWDRLDALVFVDAGQVFGELGQVDTDRFRWSYGGGIHLLNRKGLAFRFEVAGSDQGLRTILSAEPSFRRVVR